jgi:uncharacterized lipoprotein NlpE involved in copper resistance
MMKRSVFTILAIVFLCSGCNTGSSENENIYAIVPAPVSIKEMTGNFVFGK